MLLSSIPNAWLLVFLRVIVFRFESAVNPLHVQAKEVTSGERLWAEREHRYFGPDVESNSPQVPQTTVDVETAAIV